MSGRIPQGFIDELLARIDIVDVIEPDVPLKASGREFSARCPFHDEKTPSFTVSRQKQFYHCFGCGAHGTAIGFLMDYHRMGFVEAVRTLAAQAGMPMPAGVGETPAAVSPDEYALLERVARFYQRQLQEHAQAPGARAYLAKERGLGTAVIETFGVGFAPAGWDSLTTGLKPNNQERDALTRHGLLIAKDTGGHYDRFRHRIMFPIRDARGRVIGFGGRVLGDEQPKYLNSPETPLFHKGHELFGLPEARNALKNIDRLLVVEGYMDVLALAQHGIGYAVATLGTATTEEHARRLFRIAPEVVFCFDGDRAGRQAAWRALETALPVLREGKEARFMFLPEREDPDTLVRRIGKEDFEARIVRSVPLSRFLLEGLSRQVDITHIDGRARLVELARPLLSKLSSGVFKEMLISRLAEVVRMEPARLAAVLAGATASATRPPRPTTARRPLSVVRRALTLLLHRPALAAAAAPERLAEVETPGVSLLRRVIEAFRRDPGLSCGALLERWRDTPDQARLAALAAEALLVPEEGLEEEFRGCLDRLYARAGDTRTEALLNKAQLTGLDALDAQEKAELRRLLGSPPTL